jgi:flavin reductase
MGRPTGTIVVQPSDMSAENFRLGMRRLAAGVCLIATRHEGEPHGLLATSVTSLSAEPPSLLVCVNRSAQGHGPLHRSGIFSVNVLARHHRDLAESFASSSRRQERFRVGEWATGSGAPVLVDALTSFECRVDKAIDYGTHTIVIGIIDRVRFCEADAEPLIYFDGAFGRLAGPA